jgi:hypothetical protein
MTSPTHKQENECTAAAIRYIWLKEKNPEEPKPETSEDETKPTK